MATIIEESEASADALMRAHRRLMDGAAREAGVAFCAARPASAIGASFATLGALQAARTLVRAGDWPGRAPPVLSAARPSVSAIVCSITPAKLARVRDNLETQFARFPFELIAIEDARSLAEGYARGLARASGELVVFSHDDVELLRPDAGEHIVRALQGCDLIGAAGTTRLEGDRWVAAGWPHAHGWVAHGDGGRLEVGAYSLAPAARGVEALDGAFFVARRALARELGFDGNTFDGFHLYDLDFSYRAHRAGADLRVETGLWLRHASGGNFDAVHARYGERFRAKFGLAAPARHYAVPGGAVPAASNDEARGIFGWLETWLT